MLSRPLIESALKQAGLPSNVRVIFPKRIAIHRPGQEIAPATFAQRAHAAVEAMAQARWGDGHTIAIAPIKIRSALVVPKGVWSVEARTRTDDPPLGASLITLRVMIDGHEVAARPTSVKIAVEGPICHAARAVRRGETLFRDDLIESRGAIARGVVGCKAALGQEAKGSLRPNTPLKARQLQPPRLVKRGDQVTITYVSGGLRIVAEGEAMKDGAAGEWIPVSNQGSRRVIKAQVSGHGRVQIQ